jgi:hypothetical protein
VIRARAARHSGVARSVAGSGLDADPSSPFCYAVSYGYTEQPLAESFRVAMTSCPLYRVSLPGWADGSGGDGCLPGAAASASRIRGQCDAFSLGTHRCASARG